MLYKLITKVLVKRLRPFLNSLIGPFQNSFVPGRETTNNALIAQEVLHFMHCFKSKQRVITVKIDLKKACDRVK
jgi:hypothetical protein